MIGRMETHLCNLKKHVQKPRTSSIQSSSIKEEFLTSQDTRRRFKFLNIKIITYLLLNNKDSRRTDCTSLKIKRLV